MARSLKLFMKYLISLVLLLFNLKSFADTIITECKVEKIVYVHMASNNSLKEKDKTEFTLSDDTKNVREIYILTRGNTDIDTPDFIAYKLGFYNILYRNPHNPEYNWDLLNNVKTQNGDGRILSDHSPIVIRIHYPAMQEQLYYFNLDTNGDGHMSIASTRWQSPLNLINNQSISYGTCKKPKNTN